jgi:perosamine synthetase
VSAVGSPPIPFFKPYFPERSRAEVLSGISGILESGVLIDGDFTKAFEEEFAELVGTKYAVALNSCTTAMQVCLQYVGVNGHEVLVPSGSFVTDINVVSWAGGSPVLVDMNPETLAFDLVDLERKCTSQTKAVIWVHLTGNISTEYLAIQEFARSKGLFLVEDSAHAHGAVIDGQTAGSLGDGGCFSFYPTKVMTAGSGGMLTTNDRDLAEYAQKVRFHGKNPKTGEVTEVGNNWYLDEIRACVGLRQLRDLPQNLERRREIAKRYTTALSNRNGIRALPIPESSLPSYYQYAVYLAPELDAKALQKVLKAKHGVPTKNIYRPTHEEPIFKDLNDGTLGATEATLHQSMCLPIYPDLTDAQADEVVAALLEELSKIA